MKQALLIIDIQQDYCPGGAYPPVEIHPLVAPENQETVIEKAMPNGFVGTDLEESCGRTASNRSWSRA